MIHYVEGFPGLGKTYFSVVELAPKLIANRVTPYENIISNVRGYESKDFDVEDLERPNSLYIIDEIQKFNKFHDKLFLHLCEHRHLGQDWIIMTQCKDAIPRKFMGLIERSYCLEPVAGSSATRAVCRIGKPNQTNKVIISNDIFRPRATDIYQTVSVGAEIPKRKMPIKYILMFAAVPLMLMLTISIGKASYSHFAGDDVVTKVEPSSRFSPSSIVKSSFNSQKVKPKIYNVSPSVLDKCPKSLGADFDTQLKFLDCNKSSSKEILQAPKIKRLRYGDRLLFSDDLMALNRLKVSRPSLNLEHYMLMDKQNNRLLIQKNRK